MHFNSRKAMFCLLTIIAGSGFCNACYSDLTKCTPDYLPGCNRYYAVPNEFCQAHTGALCNPGANEQLWAAPKVLYNCPTGVQFCCETPFRTNQCCTTVSAQPACP